MTSTTIRKILIAGVAIATLSVAACKKPDASNAAAADANAASASANAAAADANTAAASASNAAADASAAAAPANAAAAGGDSMKTEEKK